MKIFNKLFFGLIIFLASGASVVAIAQDEEAESPKKGIVKMDFEDQLVKGNRENPEAQFIFTRTQFNYQKMIKFREDFIPEAKKGKDEFRGNR